MRALISGPKQFVFICLAMLMAAAAYALNPIPGPTAADLAACHDVQAYLAQGSESCAANQKQIERYATFCATPRLYGPQARQSEEYAMGRHALFNLLFDREQMMLFRLKPVEAHLAEWAAFKAKWQIRLRENPDVMAIDRSDSLVSDARGGLQLRVDSIDNSLAKARQVDANYLKMLGHPRGTGFYLLAARLMIQSLDNAQTLQAYTTLALGDADVAGQQVTSDKDMIYMMFPELEFQPMLNIAANSFMLRYGLNADVIAKRLLTPNTNGQIASLPSRVDGIVRLLDATLKDDDISRDFLSNLEGAFNGVMQGVIGELDRSYDQAQRDPGALTSDGIVISMALSELDDTNAIPKQNLLSLSCLKAYDDARWKWYNDLNAKYGDWILSASFVAMFVGGSETILGRVGLRLMGQAILGQRIFTFMSRVGMLTLSASGAVATAVAVPTSALSLIEYLQKYQETARAFYLSSTFDDGSGNTGGKAALANASDVQMRASLLQAGHLNVLVNFAPFLLFMF